MSPSIPSFRAHRIVEYIKEYGLWLETDEVEELGPLEVLYKHFGIRMVLSLEEQAMIMEELLQLAEQNEIREAMVKLYELKPEDRGTELVRQHNQNQDSFTSYPVQYSYPVDENLRAVNRPGSSFSCAEKKPPKRRLNGGARR